jgi:hypothetical protein
MTKQQRESLAKTLLESTTPGHPNFDPVFNKEIRELRPDWFDSSNCTNCDFNYHNSSAGWRRAHKNEHPALRGHPKCSSCTGESHE